MSLLGSKLCIYCRTLHRLKTIQPAVVVPVRFSRRKLSDKQVYKELYRRRLAQGPEPERPRSVWVNWNYDAELYAFGKRLGEDFKEDTLRKAFTHSSYIEAEQRQYEDLSMEQLEELEPREDNTQLVQKGFEMMNTHLKGCLRHYFPMLPEESVRSVTAYLVSDKILAHVGSNIGIKDLILTQEFPVEEETISKTLQAVIGALLQDQGRERAEKFIQDFLLTQLIGRDINDFLDIVNPMGLLSGILASQERGQPEPRLLFQSGSETLEAVYMVGIYSDRDLLGKSYGESVQIAEEMAARDALCHIFGTTNHRAPFNHNQPIKLADKDYQENVSILDYTKHQQLH